MPSRRQLLGTSVMVSIAAGCLGVPIESDTPSVPDLPSLDQSGDQVRWAHETIDDPVGIRTVGDPIELPAEPVFVQRNDTDRELTGNPYGWQLYKLVDGKWYWIAPRGAGEPGTKVEPGIDVGFKFVFRHERRRLDREEFEPEEPESLDEYDPERHPIHTDVVTGLGGGWYAVVLPLAVREGVTHAIAVELGAPAAPLTYDKPREKSIEDDIAVFDYAGRAGDDADWYVIREVPADHEADIKMVAESLTTRIRSPLRNGIAGVRTYDAVDTVYVRSSISGEEFRDEPVIGLDDRRYAIGEADPPNE